MADSRLAARQARVRRNQTRSLILPFVDIDDKTAWFMLIFHLSLQLSRSCLTHLAEQEPLLFKVAFLLRMMIVKR